MIKIIIYFGFVWWLLSLRPSLIILAVYCLVKNVVLLNVFLSILLPPKQETRLVVISYLVSWVLFLLIFRRNPFIIRWFSKSQYLISHVTRADRSLYLGIPFQNILNLNILIAYNLLMRLSFLNNSLFLQFFHSETVLIPESPIFRLRSPGTRLDEFLDKRGILLPMRDVIGAATLAFHGEVLLLIILISLLGHHRHTDRENACSSLRVFCIWDSYLDGAAPRSILFSRWLLRNGGYPLAPEIIWTDLLLWYNFHYILHFGFFLIVNYRGPFSRDWGLPRGDYCWDRSHFDINSKVILQLFISAWKPLAFLAKQLVLPEAYGYVWIVIHYNIIN